MTEIMGEAQNPRHITTAHFGSRFTDLAIELSRLFDDEDARLEPFSFEHERGCGAGKCSADDYDVIFKIHATDKMDAGARKRNQFRQAMLCHGVEFFWHISSARRSLAPSKYDIYKCAFDFSRWDAG